MRKLSFLFLFAALSLVSTATFAQDNKEEVKAVTVEVQQDMEEVALSDLPDAVKKTLGETFAEYAAEKALKAKKDDKVIYYIKLQKDGEFVTVMIDAEGKVIEPEGENK